MASESELSDVITALDELDMNSSKHESVQRSGIVHSGTESKFDTIQRYSLYPVKDPETFDFYRKQMANMWLTTELGTFSTDKMHYEKRLTTEMRRVLDISLAFFLPGDGLVNNNVITFLTEAKTMEEQMFFFAQMAIEAVHADTYGLYVFNIHGKEGTYRLQHIVANTPYMQQKMEFMEKWTLSTRPKQERLLAWACVEGIFFSVLFAVIFWFRSQGNLLPTLIQANEFISRDETLHRDFGCHLYKKLGGLPQETAMEIILEAVRVEENFISWLLKIGIKELNRENMIQYLGLVTDNLLVQAGLPKYFNTSNPFPWMNDIALVQKHNFYELRGASYTRGSITDSTNRCNGADDGKQINQAYSNPTDVDF